MSDEVKIDFTAGTEGLDKSLKDAVARAASQLDQMERAQQEAAAAGKDHVKTVAALQREVVKGLKPYEKTALRLEQLKRTRVEGAEAERLLADAIAQTTKQLEDQHKRDFANKGRSLSMLFDEQNAKAEQLFKGLSALPGPLGQVAGSVAGLSSAAGGASASAATLTATLGTTAIAAGGLAVGVVAAAGAMLSAAAASAENTDRLIKMAESTGVAATELSRYQQLAEKTLPSGDVAKFGEALQKLASDTATKELEKIGITATGTQERMAELSDWFVKTGNTAERSAVMTKVFGDGLAREVAPALALGSKGIADLQDENDRFGRSLSVYTIPLVGKYKDAQQELGGSTAGLRDQFVELTPVLTAALNVMGGSVRLITRLVQGVKSAGENAAGLVTAFGMVISEGKTLDEALDVVATRLREDELSAERGAAAHAELAAAKEKVGDESKKAAPKVEDLRASYERLLDTAEPLRVKTREYETALADLRRALNAGKISQSEFTRAVGIASSTYSDAIGAITPGQGALSLPEIALPDIGDGIEESVAGFGDAIGGEAKKGMEWLNQTNQATIANIESAGAMGMAYVNAFAGPAMDAAKAFDAYQKASYASQQAELKKMLDNGTISRKEYATKAAALERESALKSYRREKALGISQALINTASGAISAFAQTPGELVIKSIAAGLATAFGLAQVAMIAATPPPSFHTGFVGAGNVGDINATVQRGEGVHTAAARAIIGDDNIARANRGQAPMAPRTEIIYDRAVIGRAILDDVRAGGLTSRALRETSARGRLFRVSGN